MSQVFIVVALVMGGVEFIAYLTFVGYGDNFLVNFPVRLAGDKSG